MPGQPSLPFSLRKRTVFPFLKNIIVQVFHRHANFNDYCSGFNVLSRIAWFVFLAGRSNSYLLSIIQKCQSSQSNLIFKETTSSYVQDEGKCWMCQSKWRALCFNVLQASTNMRLKWKYPFNLNYSIYYHKHHNKQLLNFRKDLLLTSVFNRSFIHV